MKKLLGLLGTIMITGNAIPSVIAAAPNQKHGIKKRQNNENTSTTPKPQYNQQFPDIIEKEITLNENYSNNIQKMLKELIDKNYIDPLRSINMGGLISKELDNKTIISKLEELEPKMTNWFRNQQNNKDKILILTLKNSNNESVKLVINLNNLYLLGFINNQNQYFYFDDELLKRIEQINQEEITKLNNLKDKLNNLKENNFLSNEKKVKEYLQQKNEVIPLKAKEKNNKKLNYNNELNSLNKKISNLHGENLKDDEEKIKTINNTVIKKYNYQKINLNYTGAYSEDGLNVVIKQNGKPEGKDIFISQDTLNNAIANLSKYNNKQENQTIKDDLVRIIFITSEAIRFQCDEKNLEIFANINNIDELQKIIAESQNILKNIQEKVFNKKENINWKDYTSQLRGDWKKYSEQLNKFRIEIWDQLNDFKKFFSFINDSKHEISEFLTKILDNLDNNIEKSNNEILKIAQETNLIQKISKYNLDYEEVIIFLFTIKKPILTEKKWKKIEFCYFKPLHLIILQRNLDLIKLLINTGIDVNINLQDKNGLTPLILAISFIIGENNTNMVQLLIDSGADVNLQDKNGLTPLDLVVNEDNTEMVKLLIANGADVNLQNKNGWTPLYYAIQTRNIQIVKLLIDSGADVNLQDKNKLIPLYLPINEDNTEMVKLLIANGADVNIQDKNKLTPLCYAIINNENNTNMVQLLIDGGADVNLHNQDENGLTPLCYAINQNNTEMVKLLIANGADVNLHNQDKNGWTPLYYAIQTGNIQIVKLLIDGGADVNLKIGNCLTPLLYSKYKKNIKIENLLKNFQNLKSKLESLNKKLEKTKNEEEGKKIKNNLKQIEKELKALLKIELSDVITQTELGEISNNSSQTILNRVKELNSNVDINQVKIQDNNITDTTAVIESIEQHINLNDTIKVVFKISKKIEKISGAQKINIRNESYFEWLKRIFLNHYTIYNNIINTNISGYKLQGDTNKTQSKNIKLSNQNIWYDVPSDNSCLFWAVATAYLLPVRNDNEEFGARFIKLFGKENIKNWRFIQKLLQQFDLTNHISRQDLYQNQIANNLVTDAFRNRVVDYIQSNLDTVITTTGELTFRDLIQENNDIDNNYLERMREPSTWGGIPEIIAITNILNANISVNNDAPYQPINQNSTDIINIFHVNNGTHYNFALLNQTPQTDAEYKKSTGGSCLNEEDNDIENNSLFLNFPQLKKDEYHFIDQKTEQNSLKNDENLNIYLIKNENKIINKYNYLSKEQKQQKLNEINQHFQILSENDKKDFIDKLKAIGTSAIGAGISGVGTKITVSGSATSTAAVSTEAIEMTPLLSEGGLTAAETLSVAEGTAVVATEGAVIGTEAATASALAPETLGLSLVIGGLAIAGTAIIWWLNGHDNNSQALKHESHNQYNEIEKYYKFLAHDQLKLDINSDTWDKIKQIYQENSNNYQEFKNQIKSEITNFHKENHSGWGGSITDNDINTLINIIYNHFQEINNHFLSNPNHGWKIVTNTISSYFIIEEE